MPYNAFTNSDNFLIVGNLQTQVDYNSGSKGNATIAGAIGGGVNPATSASATALAASGTITTQNIRVARIAPTAAVAACVMQAGNIDGQTVEVINEAASTFSVTFAASGSSNVADGVTTVISPLRSAHFVWDQTTALWYRGA